MTSFRRTFSKSTESSRVENEFLLCPAEIQSYRHPPSPSHNSQVDQSKPLNPNDSEVHNYVPASDDDDGGDAGGVVTSNPRFVRSFKRRIRTRESRGWRYKTLSGAIESTQPEPREQEDKKNMVLFTTEGKSLERNVKGMFKNGENNEEVPSVKTCRQRILSSMEVSDSETGCRSSPVLWGVDTTTPRQHLPPETNDADKSTDDHAPDNEREEEQGNSLEGRHSTSMGSINEAVDTSVDINARKTRDFGAGFSFLTRLSKSVSLKRKKVKSHAKSRPLHLKVEVDDKETAVKENLKCIPENSQENSKVCVQIQQPVMLGLKQDMINNAVEEHKVPCTVEVNNSQRFSPNSQWFLNIYPTDAETSRGGSSIRQQHGRTLPNETSAFSQTFLKPPPSYKTRNPSCVLGTNQSLIPECEEGTCSQSSSISDQHSNPLQSRCSSSSNDSFWPTVFSSTARDAEHQNDLTTCNTSTLELDYQNQSSLLHTLNFCPTIMLMGDLETLSLSSVRKISEDGGITQESQLPQHNTHDLPQSVDYISPQHTKLSHADDLEEENMLMKNMFLSSFECKKENINKFEAEKGAAKNNSSKQERHPSGERKVTEVKASVTPTRIRRVGAIKKCDDVHHLLDDCRVSLTSILTIPHQDTDVLCYTHSKKPSLDSSTGTIQKSSQVSKASRAINKDKTKSKRFTEIPIKFENSTTDTKCQEAPDTRKETEKSHKKRERHSMIRSTSVPFWTKLHSLDSSSTSTTDNICLAYSKLLVNEDKLATKNTEEGIKDKQQATSSASSRLPFNRKVTHKRARSQDMSKTFKDEIFAVAPERSASHDNITKLKREKALKLSSLAVDFQPSDPTAEDFPCDGLVHLSHHASCSDIIDKETRVSPKLMQSFRDSKVKSVSASCLSNTTTKKTPEGKDQEGDSYPSGGSSPTSPSTPARDFHAGDMRNLRASQLLYTSPYDLVNNARDKPYFQRLIRVFQIQATDSKMDSLVQQLDLYSKQGIPPQPHLLASHTPGNDDEVVVEDSWRTLVEGHDQLDERREQQQSAIWELVETEATYIHMLKVITDLFLACLCNLQNESLLYEVDTDKLFSNIQEIYCANLTFWREHVVRMLEASRSTRQPLDPTLLTDAFYKFDELFHPYTRYCLEQSNCQLYCKEKDHDNEYFKMYLAWCETQKECNRLRLVDILVQPMQRLTKYSLLLKAILKKTNLEDHKLCLHDMITHVESFVSNVNSALRHKHEQERLRDIAKRIEAYEAVEARDDELERVVRNYSDLNLTQPMPGCPEHLPRHLLHHGDLRLRDPHTSKMDVHVFLFTDLLLITKVTQRKAEKVKIVRPPYHVERLVLVELKDSTSIGLVSINEWNVAVAAFTLQCPDQRTHRTWYDTLKRAKDQYKEAQQSQDVLVYDDMTCVGHLVPRSPHPGSSRASRVSSLAHSHSGSIDLNESSPATQHHPSIDMSDVRASSASSDDSVAQSGPEIQRTRSLESGGSGAISPRPDRRPGFPKTANTLSVIPPYSTGQSLPNLTVESANSLRVPGTNGSNPKALSPCTRGVSYPPPSPRTLRRSAPVPQSRNPPLLKSRHVTSMVGSPQDVDQGEQDDTTRGQRRTYRIDRMDNRRYHTAGAIDDIKKQDAKDATIHKRLSWNYGQGPPPSRDLGNDQGKLGRHKHAVKNISCESVHSSSGVSSTSSLHRSMGSEVEALENIDDNELEDGEATVVDLTVSDCTSLKISPHISTTYICHDSDITLGVCSQYITQPNCSPEPSEGCENLVKIDVSETDPGISSVQITVTEGAAATSSSSSNLSPTSPLEIAPTKPEMMREILLNDASVEASDV